MNNRSLILLSCSHHKASGGVVGRPGGRCFSQFLSAAHRSQLFEKRNEIRRMLRGGPPRLYNEDQKSGYRDERVVNRQLRDGEEFGGADPAAYLPAFQRYTGRFFGQLNEDAPHFWNELPASIEVVFASALHGLVLWDEPVQDYDCHFADHTDDDRPRKVKDTWGGTLTDALCDFLRAQSGSSAVTTAYDFLSESLYQSLFTWERIQGAAVYHRIFRGVSGPDVLTRLAGILAANISGFAQGTYKPGWYRLARGDDPVEFGFELKIGQDPTATREGDIEKLRNRLIKEHLWVNRLSEPVRDALVLADLSWRKAESSPKYEWGGVAVSFIKPVERYLKESLRLSGKETLGDVVYLVGGSRAWRQIYQQVRRLNGLYVNAKHLKGTPLGREDVARARSLAFEILPFAVEQRRLGRS